MSRVFVWAGLAFALILSPLQAQPNGCRVSEAIDPRMFDYARHHMVNTEHAFFGSLVNARMVGLNASDAIVPELAESWQIDNKNQSITFSLSPHCGWSDGTTITAEDVVQGLRGLYRFDPPTFSGWQIIQGAEAVVNDGAPIETLQIEAIDERTLRIDVTADPAFALYALTVSAFTPMPTHIPGHDMLSSTSTDRVFSGPFYITGRSGGEIELLKNPYFCNADMVEADERRFLFARSQSERTAMFRAGKLDIVTDVPHAQANVLIREFPQDRKPSLVMAPTHRQVNLMLNPNHHALQSMGVRGALRDALDMEAILRQGSEGNVDTRQLATSVLHDVLSYQNVAYPVNRAERNEAVAHLRRLMEEQGYNADNPARLKIITFPVARFERTARLIASMLSQAHFQIELVELHSFTEIIESFSERQADMYLTSWTLDFPHARNSWDGIFFYFQQLQLPDGSWKDFSPANEFLTEIADAQAKIANSEGAEAMNAALQEAERLLNGWHFVLPVYSEQVPALVSWDHELETAHPYWRRYGGCR